MRTLILLFCLCSVGCQRTSKPLPAQQPSAPSAPVAPPAPIVAPTPPPAVAAPPASWSDPRVIAELVKNCAFNPDDIPFPQRKEWIGALHPGARSPLSCALGFDQSCVYDPCYDDETRNCRPRCASTCGDCGKQCATTCETCKKGCADDACRTACAQSCATCRQDCVRTRDRCTTGTCTEEYRRCRKKLKDDWRSRDCPAVCRTYLRCQKSCLPKYEDKPAEGYDACDKPCQPKNNHGCNFQFCGGAFGMGVNPLEWK